MRLKGAPVLAIVERTGVTRSTLYEKFCKYDEGFSKYFYKRMKVLFFRVGDY